MKMGLKIRDESFGPVLPKLYRDLPPPPCLDQSVLVLFDCCTTTSLMLLNPICSLTLFG